jgi:hypothetical protein
MSVARIMTLLTAGTLIMAALLVAVSLTSGPGHQANIVGAQPSTVCSQGAGWDGPCQ